MQSPHEWHDDLRGADLMPITDWSSLQYQCHWLDTKLNWNKFQSNRRAVAFLVTADKIGQGKHVYSRSSNQIIRGQDYD